MWWRLLTYQRFTLLVVAGQRGLRFPALFESHWEAKLVLANDMEVQVVSVASGLRCSISSSPSRTFPWSPV